MDFSQIKLSRWERKMLKCGLDQYFHPDGNVERLVRFGLAEEELQGTPGFKPAPTGRIKTTALGGDYLQHYRISFRERWLPYWITTGISILALLIALLALLAQLGLLQLPQP